MLGLFQDYIKEKVGVFGTAQVITVDLVAKVFQEDPDNKFFLNQLIFYGKNMFLAQGSR